MRSLETVTMPILLFLNYISAFWDHNLEITIGFHGLGQSGPRCEVGLGMASPPMLGTSDPVCPGPIPTVYACLHTFIFPLITFRGSDGRLQPPLCVAGGFGCMLGRFYGLS
jgi:hypothetical protein